MNGEDKYFVDTNVLLYAYDRSSEDKRNRARAWLDCLWRTTSGYLSWQVLQEFYHNAVQKLRVPPEKAQGAVRLWSEWHPPEVTLGLLERAGHWTDQAGISFWDAMILAAAERSRCRWLLSEDFQAGREFGSVTVINPFKTEPPASAARL